MVWQKGQTGNPGGRPKTGLALYNTLQEMLESVPKDIPTFGTRNNKTYRILIADALLKAAAVGNIRAISLVFLRVDGRPRDPSFEQAAASLVPLAVLRELQQRQGPLTVFDDGAVKALDTEAQDDAPEAD